MRLFLAQTVSQIQQDDHDILSTSHQAPFPSHPAPAAADDVCRPVLEPAAARGRSPSGVSLAPPTPANPMFLDTLSAVSAGRSADFAPQSPHSHAGSSTTTAPPVFSVAGSRASSEITLSRYQSRETMSVLGPGKGPASHVEESPFAFSPAVLAEMVSSKSIAEFAALGGLAELAQGLRTDLAAGLGLDETWSPETVASSSRAAPLRQDECDILQARKTVYGTNRMPDKKIRGILELMIVALSDRVLILLSVVAAISLSLGLYQSFWQPHAPGQPRVEWVDGVTIMAAVMIVVVAGAVNDYQKERQFARLSKKVRRPWAPGECSIYDQIPRGGVEWLISL